MSKHEERFEEIAEEAISEASEVPCTLEEFASGLNVMIETLKNRRAQVADELGENK